MTRYDHTEGLITPATITRQEPGALRIPEGKTPEGDELLTDREREVAQLLAQGKTQSEIAKELIISGETVRTYRQKIADKWNTDTSGHKALQIAAKGRGYA